MNSFPNSMNYVRLYPRIVEAHNRLESLMRINKSSHIIFQEMLTQRIAVGDTSKSYIQLIISWINLNRMVPLNSYAPQALAIRNKFTETYMRFSAFQLKFSIGIRKVKEINELCPHLFEAMKTLRNIEQLSSEEVEDVNRQLQVGISKVMEEAAISVVLLVEWFAMNQGIFSDLDDCVEGMKALIEQGLQEIIARRKTRRL